MVLTNERTDRISFDYIAFRVLNAIDLLRLKSDDKDGSAVHNLSHR